MNGKSCFAEEAALQQAGSDISDPNQGLETQAAMLEYVQNHGTEQAQLFLHQRQRYLKDWGLARQKAANDRKSDWERLWRKVRSHMVMLAPTLTQHTFFEANLSTLSRSELAVALRNILLAGPSKTTRTPMIVGPTNSGKSTFVLPFDSLFGFGQVFHKHALGSSFFVRNILKDKKFLFWDDFRPVEYGQRTVPVTTFLSLFQEQPFEAQVSQSFNEECGFRVAPWLLKAVRACQSLGVSSAKLRAPRAKTSAVNSRTFCLGKLARSQHSQTLHRLMLMTGRCAWKRWDAQGFGSRFLQLRNGLCAVENKDPALHVPDVLLVHARQGLP